MPSVLLNDKTFDVGHLAFGHDLIVLSDGRLLATWVPVGDDGTDMGLISGQFYGADGAAQGAEFTLANGYGSNSGLGLSTFALGHGGFAINSYGFSSNENTFEHKIDFFDKFATITKEINNTFSGFNAPDVAFPFPHGGIYI